MNCYKAVAMSRRSIRKIVYSLKKEVGLERSLCFPIIQFAENVLPILIPDFQFEIVPESEMGSKHGETYPNEKLIKIREDVYLRAIRGEGRDRFTVAHEIGHLLMHGDRALALCRLAPNERLKPFEDPEWQADAFGGELLASSYLIKGMNAYEVAEKCCVTVSAANVQLKSLN